MQSIDDREKKRRFGNRAAILLTILFALISSTRALYRALNPRDQTDIHFTIGATIQDLQPMCAQIPPEDCVRFDAPPADSQRVFPHLFITQHVMAPRLLSHHQDCAWCFSYRNDVGAAADNQRFTLVDRSERGHHLYRLDRSIKGRP